MRTKNGIRMPARATKESACYDLFAPKDIKIKAGEWTEFGTGVYLDGTEAPVMKLKRHNMSTGFDDTVEYRPLTWVMTMHPRSGLGFKHIVRIANTTGIVDQDYRDEIRCKLTAEEDVTIPKGKAYAQAMFVPYLVLQDEIAPEDIRKGGFGSTDKVE